jgi:hypothetical protein
MTEKVIIDGVLVDKESIPKEEPNTFKLKSMPPR